MIRWIFGVFELSKVTGLKFALKYKLRLAKEGKDFISAPFLDESDKPENMEEV